MEKISFGSQLQMLQGIKPVAPIAPKGVENAGEPKEMTFVDYLKQQVSEVNQLGLDSDRRIEAAVAGKDPNPHATMVAIQKADISFRLMLSVKERLVQAYEQVIRTSV